jgi:hypothetical protein
VPKNAQAVATLRKNVAVLWVPPAGKSKGKKAAPAITKIAQLAGRRIGVVGRTDANVNLLKVILRQYGVDQARSRSSSFRPTRPPKPSVNQKGGCLSRGRSGQQQDHRGRDRGLDARRRHAEIPRDRLGRSDAQNHPPTRLPKSPPEHLAARREARGGGQDHQLRASHRGAQGRFGIDGGAFTRQLFAIRQTLKNEFRWPRRSKRRIPTRTPTIPVHPGAAAFVDGEEKTFLDRYSDFIWWGLMGLSAMGSAGAWFAGYLKKDERNVNVSQRDRLLDMLATARQCDSMEELDQMQAEADAILRDTLLCFEHGTIEEGTLTAFNIAIEQFHNAVADRKALLMSMPQNLQRASAQFRAAGSLNGNIG